MTTPNNLFLAGAICAVALSNTVAYSQKDKNPGSMSTTLKMQCDVKGEGDPIVLVGGGLTGWKSWEPFVESFNAKQRKVIRLQLLAVQYGLEDRALPENYSIKTESGAMAAALDSLKLDGPVDVVAWSFGGFASLDYALDHPDKIRTLTLIEPPAIWVLRETGRFDADMQKRADFFMTFQGDITEDMLAAFLVEAGFVAPGKSPRDLPQWPGWVPFRRSLRCNPAAVTFRDSKERLKKFQAPVLLVKGAGSSPWLHNVVGTLSENLPNARVAEFPGGHAAHIASRDKFLAELESFQKNAK